MAKLTSNSLTLIFLVAGVLTTGCLNSIFTKYQDNQCVDNCEDPNPSNQKKFEQPVLQTLQMFIGESTCWLIVLANYLINDYQKKNYKPLLTDDNDINDSNDLDQIKLKKKMSFKDSLILCFPTICDILGTTLMNLGLLYTPVSIYQMTRGALVIFVALFSIFFLKKHITRVEWLSLFLVFLGVGIVGLSGSKSHNQEQNSIPNQLANEINNQINKSVNWKVFVGIGLILLAQIFTASQFVLEEHILSKLQITPAKVVGYEGSYGTIITFISMIFLHLFIGTGPFNLVEAFSQMFNNSNILLSSIAIMISISCFNFFGISITNKLSATSRSTIDTCRTLLVWFVSMYLGWEYFKFLQLIGFSFLVFGTLVFNKVIFIDDYLPLFFKKGLSLHDERSYNQPFLNEVVDEPIERM
ncbi:uncharacterized protein ASCRUDRAFT_70499 [Ascoidea rubescens DSM 1968]|uniref:Integral membrane protein n=1 Tax=Ascoidea rubescens DSM 1968 TaxID=1344418 RepID=A0A1D2VG75_9ASCO|nr:hypothetical protein ASCRUDRAFT_70499 [Ascoidea rubescens DSM 1968]ODV60592.1 hypothetical protein ASCRUDRAFT_70499 [Ascoidea rubescens DSM 1968]